jgi:hypothetical protein
MFNLLKTDILDGWSVGRRYLETGDTSQEELDRWFKDAKRLFATASIKVRK